MTVRVSCRSPLVSMLIFCIIASSMVEKKTMARKPGKHEQETAQLANVLTSTNLASYRNGGSATSQEPASDKRHRDGLLQKKNSQQKTSENQSSISALPDKQSLTSSLRSRIELLKQKSNRSIVPDFRPRPNATQGKQKEESYTVIRQKYFKGIGCFCDVHCLGCSCNLTNTTSESTKNMTRINGTGVQEKWKECLQNSLKKRSPSMKNTTSSWACVNDIWMITSCGTNWSNNKIRERCLKGMNFLSNNLTIKDSAYQVPVFTANGVVFRNRYCAMCNNHKTFTPYNTKFTCSLPPPAGHVRSKIRDYLFNECTNPIWAPQGDQPRETCPNLELPCSVGFGRRRRTSVRQTSCRYCSGINEMTCETDSADQSVSNSLKGTAFPGIAVNNKPKRKKFQTTTLSLSVPFEFIDKPDSHFLIKVTCPQANQVYDPYLERCRKGTVSKPKLEPFDTYRISVFYEDPLRNISLSEFKSYFVKEFGSDGVRYFNDQFFSKGLQFDISVQRFRLQRLVSGEQLKTVHSKLYKYINLNETITITINETKVKIYKITYRILTCADLQIYKKHEYAFLDGYMPAVYLNKSHDTISHHDYYILKDGDIAVCKTHINVKNCTGAYVPFNDSEYIMLDNGTVRLDSSGKIFQRNKYDFVGDKVWICVKFGNTFERSYKRYNNLDNLGILTFACMIVSIISLVFVLVTYSLFAELRTPPGINLMNLSVAILLSQLLWLLGSQQTDKPVVCTVIAVLLHYFFLVSFVWTSIIAFDTWRAFTAKGRRSMADSKRKRLLHSLRYMSVGWLSVMVYVAICVALDQSGIYKIQYGSRTKCWIENARANVFITMVPIGLVVLSNVVFFSLTVNSIRKTQKQSKLIRNQSSESENRQNFSIYVRIAVMMGFTWIFGFIAPFGWDFLWYPHVVLNSSQGVYIAIAFGLNKRVRKHYMDLFRDKRKRARESFNSTKMSLLESRKRKSSSNSQERNTENVV